MSYLFLNYNATCISHIEVVFIRITCSYCFSCFTCQQHLSLMYFSWKLKQTFNQKVTRSSSRSKQGHNTVIIALCVVAWFIRKLPRFSVLILFWNIQNVKSEWNFTKVSGIYHKYLFIVKQNDWSSEFYYWDLSLFLKCN